MLEFNDLGLSHYQTGNRYSLVIQKSGNNSKLYMVTMCDFHNDELYYLIENEYERCESYFKNVWEHLKNTGHTIEEASPTISVVKRRIVMNHTEEQLKRLKAMLTDPVVIMKSIYRSAKQLSSAAISGQKRFWVYSCVF